MVQLFPGRERTFRRHQMRSTCSETTTGAMRWSAAVERKANAATNTISATKSMDVRLSAGSIFVSKRERDTWLSPLSLSVHRGPVSKLQHGCDELCCSFESRTKFMLCSEELWNTTAISQCCSTAFLIFSLNLYSNKSAALMEREMRWTLIVERSYQDSTTNHWKRSSCSNHVSCTRDPWFASFSSSLLFFLSLCPSCGLTKRWSVTFVFTSFVSVRLDIHLSLSLSFSCSCSSRLFSLLCR